MFLKLIVNYHSLMSSMYAFTLITDLRNVPSHTHEINHDDHPMIFHQRVLCLHFIKKNLFIFARYMYLLSGTTEHFYVQHFVQYVSRGLLINFVFIRLVTPPKVLRCRYVR